MDYSIFIGGAAGQGLDTLSHILSKILQRSGFYVYTTSDYLSRVRGGQNFFQIRFADHLIHSATSRLDCIYALNHEVLLQHIDRLQENGLALADEEVPALDRLTRLPLRAIAEELGNVRVFNSVGLGYILKVFGLDFDRAQEMLQQIFVDETMFELNVQALHKGAALTESSVPVVPGKQRKHILINGNNATALGAIAAGCRYYCGYPMTPSSSILVFMDAVSQEMEIVVDQVEDEVAALNMALGASYAGVRAMTGSSGGGFALMQEAMSLAGIIETPVVVINVQRPGPATGLPTYTEQGDLRFVLHAGHGEFPKMVIALRDGEDAFYQTARAFNIADKYQIPVILLSDQYLADTEVTLPPFDFSKISIERHLADAQAYGPGTYYRYQVTESGVSPRLIPGARGNSVIVDSDEHDEKGRIDESADNRRTQVDKRMRKAQGLAQEVQPPWEFGADAPELLLVCWGSLAGPMREACDQLNAQGLVVRALVYGDIWPFHTERLHALHAQAKKLVVVEQNATGQFEGLMRQEALIRADEELLKYDGRQWKSDEIVAALKEVLS